MPRLFPHLGRSSKEPVAGYDEYDPYYGHPEHGYGYDGYDYDYEAQQQERPAWRKMLSRSSNSSSHTKTSSTRTGGRAYYGEGEVPGFQRTISRSHQPNYDMYDRPARVPQYANSDDTESYVNIPSRPQSPVPIVQRESSFTDMNGLGRLQDAFADHGTYSAATPTVMIDPTTPVRGTPRMPPMSMHAAGPMQMKTVHEARHEPVIVDDSNGSVEGIRPDVDVMRPSSSKHRHHRSHRDPESLPRASKERDMFEVVTSGPVYWEHHPGQEEYPPVVVVVQRGRYGEKDTYYIVPGGAPVIFEDEYGQEITRVGDFSGYYRPLPSRPVIVEDEFGREICRVGSSDGHVSPGPYGANVNVQYLGGVQGYHRSRSSRREYYDRMYDGDYDRGYASSYRSHPSRSYDGYTDGRPSYRRNGSYEYRPPGSGVTFIDPNESYVLGGRPVQRTYSNYSGSRRGDYYDPSLRADAYGSYGPPPLVEYDNYRDDDYRRGRSSAGSGSYGSRRVREYDRGW